MNEKQKNVINESELHARKIEVGDKYYTTINLPLDQIISVLFNGDLRKALESVDTLLEKFSDESSPAVDGLRAEIQQFHKKFENLGVASADGERKNKQKVQWELENYLVPKINYIIGGTNGIPSEYIWTENKEARGDGKIPDNVRFWEINLPMQDKNTNDLQMLKGFLQEKDFKKADAETGRVILRELNRKRERKKDWLSYREVDQIPIELFYEIDQVWMLFSGGRFGISPQYQLWKTAREDFNVFTMKNGWRKRGYGLEDDYGKFQFADTAPIGHLPTFWPLIQSGSGRLNNWGRVYKNIIKRIDNFFKNE